MVRPSSVPPTQSLDADDPGPNQVQWADDSGLVAERWMKGFHGAVQSPGFDRPGELSVRDMAMSHRSLGVQRMSVLTELTTSTRRVSPPRQAQPVTFDARRIAQDLLTDATEALPGEEVFARGAEPIAQRTAARWDGSEPLADYIDRRLLEAKILLLPNRSRAYAVVKRLVDIAGSLILIGLTLPILLLLVILIRFDSSGPAVFRQTRVTGGGRTFQFYKFRTMWVDAKERFPQLYTYDFEDEEFGRSFYKLSEDPRNTRVGCWLRRTTLDELPNLFNVLKGDLSLVGPRPELPELVQYYRPEELVCFFTKAGLTGLAQVAGRSLLTVRQRLTLDMRYVSQQTFLLDQRILWRTAVVVLLRRGAF